MLGKYQCPACASSYTVYVQDVLGNRTRKKFPQHVCLDCKTFFHRSGYREDDAVQKSDFDFLVRERENHISINAQLVLELKTKLPHTKSVLEIGYGMGWFMKSWRDFGVMDAYGFEVNPYCYEHASKTLGWIANLAHSTLHTIGLTI